MEIDFTKLNEEINSAYECKVVGCDRRVCDPDSLCMGCFMGCITDEVVWDDKIKRHVKRDSE